MTQRRGIGAVLSNANVTTAPHNNLAHGGERLNAPRKPMSSRCGTGI